MSTLWPRLSESLPHAEPGRCCSCGNPEADGDLTLWQEHDEQDRPELRYVLLCAKCSRRLIEIHPRLYDSLDRNAPAPGALAICSSCKMRSRLRCTATKAAGGAGILLTGVQPMIVHLDGSGPKGRWSKWLKSYAIPPGSCTGRVEA